MTIDIIYRGLFKSLLIKQRSQKYFSAPRYICRNNVFVDLQRNNTFHIQKNKIHISLSSDEASNIEAVCESLKDILNGSFIGIKTNDLVYKKIQNYGVLTGLRM